MSGCCSLVHPSVIRHGKWTWLAGGMMGKSSNASHGLVVSGGCDPTTMVLRMIIMVECKALYSH